jgi:nucleotide-binding universal stress UspA family protein
VKSFGRILVGWDGSTDAELALLAAASLASGVHSEVVALRVVERSTHRWRKGASGGDEAPDLLDHAAEIAEELHLRHETIEADNAAAALDNYAAEHGFDLVVVGRHGAGRGERSTLGRLTEHLVRSGRPAVMVVAAPD